MKRVLILVAVLGAVAFAPVPAAASGGLPCLPVANGNGAASCTVTAKDVAVPIFVGPCLKPLGVSGVVIDANTVAHVTLLQTGPEAWFTTTATGPVAASSPPVSVGEQPNGSGPRSTTVTKSFMQPPTGS